MEIKDKHEQMIAKKENVGALSVPLELSPLGLLHYHQPKLNHPALCTFSFQ